MAGEPLWYAAPMRPFLLLFLPAFAGACSSSSSNTSGTDASAPCNENPWECPSSQTCWPAGPTSFSCLNAGPGALGTACANTEGSATCAAGLACFQALGAAAGTCVSYCSNTDPNHACTGQDACITADLGGAGGPAFSICVPPMTGNPDSGASDSGTMPSEASTGDAPAGD